MRKHRKAPFKHRALPRRNARCRTATRGNARCRSVNDAEVELVQLQRTRAKYLLIFYSVKIYAHSNMDVVKLIESVKKRNRSTILLFDDSRRAPRSAVGDAVYGDDVVLSPLPRHYQKSQKKAAAATTTSITASAILWTYICISFACNLTRVGARWRALPRGNRALPRVAAR